MVDLKLKPGRFRVGERARITAIGGFKGTEVEIIEDHGPIGVGGRRFYTIRMPVLYANDMVVPFPEDDLEPITFKEEKKPRKKPKPKDGDKTGKD